MRIGLHIASFTYPNGPTGLRDDLARIASTADDLGFSRISVMDHVWQIRGFGPAEGEMLEAYTALGFIAAHTRRAEILAWVTAAVYRQPGLLAKQISTLDVLSGGRAMLGLGAGWNEQECLGLGLPFPPVAERFERLEETLQICRQMFSDSEEPFRGKHYQLGRTLNVPQPLRRVPILVGGGGEKKTLRMVAQYADACNLFDIPVLPEKLDILRGHCERLGRDYGEIEKTVMSGIDLDREAVPQLLQRLRRLADLGVAHVHSHVANVSAITPLETLANEVIPVIADW